MIEPDGFLARFQAFEYALAFRVGRESLADFSITSGMSFYRRSALARALEEHSLSVYAEDFENAVILLSQGERIYYDGRLVVSTEGPGSVRRWFSQRVGWYHGLLKVYTERFREVLRISRRSPFAAYHYLVYVGGLSLAMHLIKVVSAVLLLLSLLSGLDAILLDDFVPQGPLINPEYFTAAISSYLALGVIALFTSVPKAERSYTAPIVPLYLCYAIVHIVPMTVGFLNFFALKLFRRRIYHDHYESPTDPSVPPMGERGEIEDDRMIVRGIPAPAALSPAPVLGGSGAAIRGRERRTGGRVCVRHAGFLQSGDPLGAAAGARSLAEGQHGNPRAGCGVRRRALEPPAGRARRPGDGRRFESDDDRAGPSTRRAEGVAERCRFEVGDLANLDVGGTIRPGSGRHRASAHPGSPAPCARRSPR